LADGDLAEGFAERGITFFYSLFRLRLTYLFVMAGLKREARLRVRPGHPRLH
jgi:hypothetical protein